jgi:NAD-dependent deacetylase
MDELERRQAIEELADLLRDCERAVVFTGAGISTESGIPDFRSPSGIWTTMAPIMFQDFVACEEMRREAWRRKFAMDEAFSSAVPNVGHAAISAMVRRGIASAVITQNIDGLHQVSGVPDDKVIELHGNTTYASCLDCGQRHELEDIREPFIEAGKLPECVRCNGMVKTATISFGQAMPDEPMRRAQEATEACDLFIAIGSSLVVYPAAGFPLLAKECGATLVILNREPTPLDDEADLVINAEIGPTLKRVVPMN